MQISSNSFELILTKYNDACNWLERLGLNIQRGRLSSYLKTIELLSNSYTTASDQELKNQFPDTVNAMYEIMAFIKIYESLSNLSIVDSNGIVSKLKKAITGPKQSTGETTNSNEARNYLFEVLVSATLHSPVKGLLVDFKSETDTGVKFLKKKYLIECKRPQSLRKLESNIRDASNQLHKTLEKTNGSNYRGIISIDISKIFNPEFDLLVKENDTALQNHIKYIMDSFIDKHSHIWQEILKTKDRKIVGVLLRVSLMGISEERNLLVSCVQWAFNPKIGISESESKHLEKMTSILD
tara:strand:+ start:494 stop:1384 length:891 start_codon:yes stop_codon:yes gene_type:complete